MQVSADGVGPEASLRTDLSNLPAEAALAVPDVEDDPPLPGLEDTLADLPPLLVHYPGTLSSELTERVGVDVPRAEGLEDGLQADGGVCVVDHERDGGSPGGQHRLTQNFSLVLAVVGDVPVQPHLHPHNVVPVLPDGPDTELSLECYVTGHSRQEWRSP